MLEKEDPENIYHAVVSSSFDADRLDYLRRDKLMTGTGAGAIDFDWLIDNIRVAEIEMDAPDEAPTESRKVSTFCLTAKALPAAEQFLLARYTLHQQVYFHKATRCAEHMIGKLLRALSRYAALGKNSESHTGLKKSNPLICFFSKNGETVSNYLALDDSLIIGSLESMSKAEDKVIAKLALQILNRKLYKTVDVAEFGEENGTQRKNKRRIENLFSIEIKEEKVILDDRASVSIYSEIGGDDEKMHKKLHILDGVEPTEISKLSPLIKALEVKKQFTRFYFENIEDRDKARTNRWA